MEFTICKGIAELHYNFPVFDYVDKDKTNNSFTARYYNNDDGNYAIWFVLSEEKQLEHFTGYDDEMSPIYEHYDGHYPICIIKIEFHPVKKTPAICYIQTNNDYKKQGYSKLLINYFVEWLIANNYKYIIRSAPTDDGKLYSWNNITNALKENNIRFDVM